MLFTLGSRASYGDVADILLACHQRIREHLALARRIATAPPSIANESVRAAALRVRRYFAESFPLHQADEEEDLFPLLAGRSEEVDQTIAHLVKDHAIWHGDVERLVAFCATLEHDPASLPVHATELARLLETLEAVLVAHIRFEEKALFPAIDLLSARERQDVLARIRARRDLVTL
jgi:iron-sulfur cluster repair protein YtfE (RIC family)